MATVPIIFLLVSWMCLVSGKHFTLEVENFVDKELRIARSRASSNFSVHLRMSDVVQMKFCLNKVSNVSLEGLVYSNDGPNDRFSITIDGQFLGSVLTVHDASREGQGWNMFKTSGRVGPTLQMKDGQHSVLVNVTYADSWGAELDGIIFDIDDNTLSPSSFNCRSTCLANITYQYWPELDQIEDGLFVRHYSPTLCSEIDNVRVEVFHDSATSFEISANLPQYNSFTNNRLPDFTNCALPNPIWILEDVPVSPDIVGLDNSAVKLTASGTSLRTNMRFSFRLDRLSDIRDGDTKDAPTELLLRLRNLPRYDVDVSVLILDGNTTWKYVGQHLFTAFSASKTWTLPAQTWSRTADNTIQLIIKPGKQNVVIDSISLAVPPRIDSTFSIHSNDRFIIEGMQHGYPDPMPDFMTIHTYLGGGFKHRLENVDVHGLKVYAKRPQSDGYSQVFMLYQTGRIQIQPLAPQGVDWIPAGSSVTLGQPQELGQTRPNARIKQVSILPDLQTFELVYEDGSLILMQLIITSTETKLLVKNGNFSKDRRVYPIMTFQSMWVKDGNADVDHVVVNGDTPRHIVSDWTGLHGKSAVFFRQCISDHNTLGPDIRITFQNHEQLF